MHRCDWGSAREPTKIRLTDAMRMLRLAPQLRLHVKSWPGSATCCEGPVCRKMLSMHGGLRQSDCPVAELGRAYVSHGSCHHIWPAFASRYCTCWQHGNCSVLCWKQLRAEGQQQTSCRCDMLIHRLCAGLNSSRFVCLTSFCDTQANLQKHHISSAEKAEVIMLHF